MPRLGVLVRAHSGRNPVEFRCYVRLFCHIHTIFDCIHSVWRNIIRYMSTDPTPTPELDERDRRILECLQKDGRMANSDLAERVNLSPSACLRRVKRLEEIGVIDRYVALLGRAKLGRAGTAFLLIKMERQSKDLFKQFERAIVEIPEVLEVHLIAGDADYIVKMAYRDAQDFERLYFEDLMNLPGVVGTQTKLSLRSVYSDTALRMRRN